MRADVPIREIRQAGAGIIVVYGDGRSEIHPPRIRVGDEVDVLLHNDRWGAAYRLGVHPVLKDRVLASWLAQGWREIQESDLQPEPEEQEI